MKNRFAHCCCAAIALGALLTATPVGAASIPAWLDEAISSWNAKNETMPIEFIDIKDQFIWYTLPNTPETASTDIRTSIYDLVLEHGYEVTDQEERVTTGKPPSEVAPYKKKKCWTRSFVRNIEELSNTTAVGGGGRSGVRQSMLTSLVCEDGDDWFTGFRILQ